MHLAVEEEELADGEQAEDREQRQYDGQDDHVGACPFLPVAIWKISRMTDTAKR